MKWLLTVFSWLCCVLAATPAAAQFPDLVDIGGQYMPPSEMADPAGVKAQIASYDGVLNIPVVLDDTTFLIPGVTYHVDSVSFAGTPEDFIDLRAFHSVDATLLAVKLLPKNWSLSLRMAGGVAGDFRGLDKEMLRLNAALLATKGFSDRFVLGLGAIASHSFGELLPLPGLYVDWTPVDWLRFETFVPGFATAQLEFGKRVEVGVHAEIAGNEYAVRDPRIRDSAACASGAPANACLDHVAYSTGAVGLKVGVRLFGSVWATAYGGRAVYRRLQMLTASNETVSGGLQLLPQQWFVRTNLTFRIPDGD